MMDAATSIALFVIGVAVLLNIYRLIKGPARWTGCSRSTPS